LMSAVDSGSAWDLRVFVRENLIKFLVMVTKIVGGIDKIIS